MDWLSVSTHSTCKHVYTEVAIGQNDVYRVFLSSTGKYFLDQSFWQEIMPYPLEMDFLRCPYRYYQTWFTSALPLSLLIETTTTNCELSPDSVV